MTLPLFIAAIIAELFLVAGQLIIKRSMLLTNRASFKRSRFAFLFAAGIAALTLYFFLWLGLMQKIPLSQQYPFDTVAQLLLVIAAALFLKERLTLRSWLGILLICAGITVISVS